MASIVATLLQKLVTVMTQFQSRTPVLTTINWETILVFKLADDKNLTRVLMKMI